MSQLSARKLELNPIQRRILRLAILDAAFVLVGVTLLLLVEPYGLLIGIAVIVAGSLASALLVLKAVREVPCPKCGRLMNRDSATGFVCVRCQTLWELPRR